MKRRRILHDFKDSRDFSIGVRLSIQRALLGEISENLRAVTVGWNMMDRLIHVKALFDSEISEEDKESMNLVETYMIADFFPAFEVTVECIRVDYPEELSDHGLKTWVYARREHTPFGPRPWGPGTYIELSKETKEKIRRNDQSSI